MATVNNSSRQARLEATGVRAVVATVVASRVDTEVTVVEEAQDTEADQEVEEGTVADTAAGVVETMGVTVDEVCIYPFINSLWI